MFSSKHNKFTQQPETKFGSINSLSLIISTVQPAPETLPPPVLKPPPPIPQPPPESISQPDIQRMTKEEFKETPKFYNNPLYNDISLEDIYTNYSEDNFKEHKPARKIRSTLKNILKEVQLTYRKKQRKIKHNLFHFSVFSFFRFSRKISYTT